MAHEILVTAQRPNSLFPFLDWEFGAWTGTWPRACQLMLVWCYVSSYLHLNVIRIMENVLTMPLGRELALKCCLLG